MKLLLKIISFCFLFPSIAFSAWTGPVEILSLNFGNGETEIGIIHEDLKDTFTTLFAVDKSGNVLIADEYNRKALIFNNTGQYMTTIWPKITLTSERVWPNEIIPISNNRLVITSGYDYQIYNYLGNLLSKINIGDNTALIAALWDGSLIIEGAAFYKYNSAGQQVQSYKTKPLELGNLHDSVPINDGYRFVLEYPDIMYGFTLPVSSIDFYNRDAQNKLTISYGAGAREIVNKISTCGKVLGQVHLPGDEISGYMNVGGEKFANYIAQYGNTTFGTDGNVYTWKKTATKYSILKWTWVDDPNVPTGPDAPTALSVMPSTTGIYLTWTASPQDPGCVTGYEVSRATSAGGVGTTVTTVDKGVVKYNDTSASVGTLYYYKIRAVAGSEYSPYTIETSGKR